MMVRLIQVGGLVCQGARETLLLMLSMNTETAVIGGRLQSMTTVQRAQPVFLWRFALDLNNDNLDRSHLNKAYGFSVRCIKD